MQTPPNNPRRLYYQPDQMTFLVTYKEDLKEGARQEQLKTLFEQANRELEGKARIVQRQEIAFAAAAPQDSPRPKDIRRTSQAAALLPQADARKPFSLVFADVQRTDRQFNLARSIYDLDQKLVGKTFADLTLQAITPNWLVSSTQAGGIGVGGPGGRPVPYMGDPRNPPYQFQFAGAAAKALKSGAGAGVDVAILDTAPCLHDLVDAYHCWHRPDVSVHPLLEGLVGPQGKLKVYPASQSDLFALRNYELEDHTYRMTDHGLFAAGIIHTIAPQADLQLIEVLNAYGVGDLMSIANGLQRLAARDWTRPLVINCSLMITIPLEKRHRWYADKALADLLSSPGFIARQGWPLEYICNLLAAQGRCLVAAAGNDATDNTDRPQARFPAAFTSVVGVGALPRNAEASGFQTASYSNFADRPQGTGLVTLGGEPGEEQGILGVYIGDFPDGTPCCHTGWAWWAGTSFATPVVSGLIAAEKSTQPGIGLLQVAHELFDPAVSANTTPQGERVIAVNQV